jgi:hypothetical protein
MNKQLDFFADCEYDVMLLYPSLLYTMTVSFMWPLFFAIPSLKGQQEIPAIKERIAQNQTATGGGEGGQHGITTFPCSTPFV